jgi:hypothetical protein
MDARDILGGGEGALPTLSSGTLTAVPGSGSFQPSGAGAAKFIASGVAGVLGMYFLAVGKREADVQKMVLGAAFSLGSLFLF